MNATFNHVQDGPEVSGTGAVTPTLPTPSRKGTLLVATLVTRGTGPFSGPETSGWYLANAEPTSYGRLEQWYYPANPGGISSAVFTIASDARCNGGMSEYSTPVNTTQVLESKDGASGIAGIDLISIVAVRVDKPCLLGVVSFAGFFRNPVPAGPTWTGPAGFALQQDISYGVTDPVASFACTDVPVGTEKLSSTFSYNEGLQAWAASYACFRCESTSKAG
jgi:hypothetical protein